MTGVEAGVMLRERNVKKIPKYLFFCKSLKILFKVSQKETLSSISREFPSNQSLKMDKSGEAYKPFEALDEDMMEHERQKKQEKTDTKPADEDDKCNDINAYG